MLQIVPLWCAYPFKVAISIRNQFPGETISTHCFLTPFLMLRMPLFIYSVLQFVFCLMQMIISKRNLLMSSCLSFDMQNNGSRRRNVNCRLIISTPSWSHQEENVQKVSDVDIATPAPPSLDCLSRHPSARWAKGGQE